MKTNSLFTKISLVLCVFATTLAAKANNVIVANTAVSGSDITFDISWENSWNSNIAPANHDAVWVFVKYQDCATNIWYHADLSDISADHTAASPLQADAVADGKGVFLRRSALGGGDISPTAVSLAMNIPAGTYNYKVFAIEMVNIPQGDFEIGDGTSTNTFNSITVTAASQSGGIPAGTIGGSSVTVPATFPMGYNSFYSMKYEITQQQYVDFLNTLTYDQQVTRQGTDPINAPGTKAFSPGLGFRNSIEILESGNNNVLPAVFACDLTDGIPDNVDDGQNIAMNFLGWGDLSAYLDWAGLRPMSELEFEKICRGPEARVAGEYPWGTTEIFAYNSNNIVASTKNKPDETVATVNNGSSFYGLGYSHINSFGPSRAGIFARSTTGRASSGAAYYGVMEMAGNLSERPVTVFTAEGAAFTGNNGDGTLTNTGEANQASWPAPDTALGSGFKGGDWSTAATNLRTSQRSGTASVARNQTYGGRGVR